MKVQPESLKPTVPPTDADRPLVLALDVGTSSVRAILFDGLGRSLVGLSARRSQKLHKAKDGTAEADPDVVITSICDAIDDLLDRASSLAAEIAAVAVCTFASNVLGLDEKQRAVTPLFTYADTRSVYQAELLRRELDEESVRQRTGCPFHASYLPAQLRWLAAERPELFAQASRWVSVGEYMESQLFSSARSDTGRPTAVSYSTASWTGLLNRQKLVWDEELLEALPIKAVQLSPLIDVDAPRFGLADRFSRRWPALRDVPWFPAVGDGAAANIGSGCVTPHRLALTLGTTSAVRVITEEPVVEIPAGLWCYRIDHRRSLPGGALTEGGNVFAWMRKTLHLPNGEDLAAALSRMTPDDHGLTVLPFLAGERSPGWVGNIRATVHGISLATTPLEILRASMEAVACRIALVVDRLAPLLADDCEIVASGGGFQNSPAWVQIVSDCLDRPIKVTRVEEASARGAALLALASLGVLADVADDPHFVGDAVEPIAKHQAPYREAKRRQEKLYDRLVRSLNRPSTDQ